MLSPEKHDKYRKQINIKWKKWIDETNFVMRESFFENSQDDPLSFITLWGTLKRISILYTNCPVLAIKYIFGGFQTSYLLIRRGKVYLKHHSSRNHWKCKDCEIAIYNANLSITNIFTIWMDVGKMWILVLSLYKENKTNLLISSNSHSSATANKAIHHLKS